MNLENLRFFKLARVFLLNHSNAKGNNSEKHQFVGYFKDMWENNIISKGIKVEKSLGDFANFMSY